MMLCFSSNRAAECVSSEMRSAALQAQVSAIIDVLAKAAVAEISQLLEEEAAALHQEIRRRNEEIRGLKTRLLLTETELQRVTADRCCAGDTAEPAGLLGVSARSREPQPGGLSLEKPRYSHTLELKREDPVTCSAEEEEEELSGLEFEMKIEQVEESQNRRDDGNSHPWSSKALDDPEVRLIESEQHSQTFPDPYEMTQDPTAQSASGLFSFSQNESFGASECGSDPHSSSGLAKTHPQPKPFRCEECGKGFTQRTRLITHRRVHTGEKPFCCQLCGKTFSRQDNCLRHVRLHSGPR
ncbi:zinc finger protein 354A-like [Sinocyclocheilus grahami]|uniref:Zinc finger protein 354A-like n=1 Tax=Sinocyclocheilus grahami TaxID=75366 RepID=A0A672RHJ5_SINGR|nr:PREDICTED: zinc finger protein 354A-like [Sinocyclocheilus grahami]